MSTNFQRFLKHPSKSWKSKKTIELIEYFEKLKNLDDLTKDKKIIDIKKRKKTYRKRKFYKKTK